MYFNETLPDGLYIVHRFLSAFALSETQMWKVENLQFVWFYIFWVEKYRNDPLNCTSKPCLEMFLFNSCFTKLQ